VKAVPVIASCALVLAACGSGGGSTSVAQQPAAPAAAAPAPAAPAATSTDTDSAPAAADPAAAAAPAPDAAAPVAAPAAHPAVSTAKATVRAKTKAATKSAGTKTSVAKTAPGADKVVGAESAADKAANQKIYDDKQGATDIGVTKNQIHMGSVNMHGMALGNVLTEPQVRGDFGAIAGVNDRGGVLGRRIILTDCDDGPGEVSRAKACIKKLVGQDHVFNLITGLDWATASIHDDLKQYHLPYVGAWAYSQTEWQDPFMFPTHMSMIHEAMSGAHWAVNVIHPQTYGLICLTSPEMQIACNQVRKIVDTSGAKMVKRADVSISETSMSSYVLAFRAANPDHIIHYVINPSTMAKFMVEAAQQGYYPPKGMSGNHLGAEVLGSIFGKWPTGRYWTNTTYKLWGTEFMATMQKYARGNSGTNHHIVQAGYVAVNIFAQAAKEVGPNLTRDRLMAQLSNGTVWKSDASMDQKFSWVQSERFGDNWNHEYGQGREFMYRYDSTNTVSNPDGTPNGFTADGPGGPDYAGNGQFVLHTWK
jgi:hypothetical protein